MKKLLLLVLLMAATIPAAAACPSLSGTCWFVATTGDDENPGTIEQPFQTFRPAITQAQPGDTIYARGGMYGQDNAMVSGARIAVQGASGPQACQPHQTFTENRCYEDTYNFMHINDWSGWASQDLGYTVASGTAQMPITVRSYPGEVVELDARALDGGIFVQKNYWTIQGFTLRGNNVYIWGGTRPNNPHDITIRDNRMYDYGDDGGANIGFVKIDRGDSGGAYNIFIYNNTFHDLYDSRIAGSTNWADTGDYQHYGAVTTLSAEDYFGLAAGSTGYIEIINNTIYNVPQAFFFKNPAIGPIRIENNIIHSTRVVGDFASSNIAFTNNLVYDTEIGVWRGGIQQGNNIDPHRGWNYTISDNTFVDVRGVLHGGGRYAVVERNVVTGIRSDVSTSGWDNPRFLFRREEADVSSDYTQGLVATWTVNNNCIVSPVQTPGYLRVRTQSVGGQWQTADFSRQQAQETFSFGANDIILQQDPLAPFTDPAANDYTILPDHPCAGMGWQGAALPPQAVPGDVTGDGQVTLADLLYVVQRLGGEYDASADLNNSGSVDLYDLVIVARNFGS